MTTGVILAQLGAPADPSPAAIRRFLREFLTDRRVVDLPRYAWLPLLYGVILPFRPQRLAPLYRKIAGPDGELPLARHTRELTAAVAAQLATRGITVAHAMRYGHPNLATVTRQMVEQGVSRLLLFPLFPQYSGTTTASCAALFHETLAACRHTPASRVAAAYPAAPAYIQALAATARPVLAQAGPDCLLVISFHGLPRRYQALGDPYDRHCRQTARQLAAALPWPDARWQLTYQSRFGREPWLEPATDQTLARLPGLGHHRVAVICPGFAADCLETLEEIHHTNRHIFLDAGGKDFHFIPCLNSTPAWVTGLSSLILRELSGWTSDPMPGGSRSDS